MFAGVADKARIVQAAAAYRYGLREALMRPEVIGDRNGFPTSTGNSWRVRCALAECIFGAGVAIVGGKTRQYRKK